MRTTTTTGTTGPSQFRVTPAGLRQKHWRSFIGEFLTLLPLLTLLRLTV